MIRLKRLKLKNFAIVSATEVDFGSGLSVITGETGAGKSLVVGAISLLLGERAGGETLRTGETVAVIEGEFEGDLANVTDALRAEGIDIDGSTLTLTREIHADGRSRCLVNDQRINVTTLKRIGDLICDLHGQHQHQWLLDPSRHLWFLDRFGDITAQSDEYRTLLKEYSSLLTEIRRLRTEIESARERRELYRYQLDEIGRIGGTPEEERQLETEQKQLENAARIRSALNLSHSLISQDDGLLVQTMEVVRQLRSVEDYLSELADYLRELESIRVSFSEIARSLEETASRLEDNPQRLDQIGERLAELYKLKRKYGGTMESVNEHREMIASALASGETDESELKSLEQRLIPLASDLLQSAAKLQSAREQAARRLSTAIGKELKALGMAGVRFTVVFTPNESGEMVSSGGETMHLADWGPQRAEFLFSANVGEEPRPLAKIASGGEVSRVMLALKSLIAGKDQVDLLVFDEIDNGIGGETALLVGRKLKELSRRQQVIAITHLQQIVSFADHHFKAVKRQSKGRTESELLPLSDEERIAELGRMISGGNLTDIERKQAEKLLAQARGEKNQR